MHVAKKVFNVKGDDGTYRTVRPGDEVPEAENWPNLGAWERQGYLRFVALDGRELKPSRKTAAMSATQKQERLRREASTPAKVKTPAPVKEAPKTEAPIKLDAEATPTKKKRGRPRKKVFG